MQIYVDAKVFRSKFHVTVYPVRNAVDISDSSSHSIHVIYLIQYRF